jgi:hypothetical protein
VEALTLGQQAAGIISGKLLPRCRSFQIEYLRSLQFREPYTVATTRGSDGIIQSITSNKTQKECAVAFTSYF